MATSSTVGAPLSEAKVLYFAYGSNLSPTQMANRCPNSKPIALAHLPGWKWLINGRGYANIVLEGSAVGPGVYGVLYDLDPADEMRLDGFEGVPIAYEKCYLEGTRIENGNENPPRRSEIQVLAYVDFKRVSPSIPKNEYVDRMNRGIEEAVRDWGLPKVYVDEVMRPFIPVR